MFLKPLVTLLLFLSQTQAIYHKSTACNLISNATLSGSKIRFTSSILAGSNFTGDSAESSYNVIQTELPEACRVACEVQTSGNSTARFEVWLPTKTAWNTRFLGVGNGGWAGGINYPDVVTGLKRGQNLDMFLKIA
jgi:feruloyl esterase